MPFNLATASAHQPDGNCRMRRQSDENRSSHEGSLPGISSYRTTVTNDYQDFMSDEHITSLLFHHFSSFIVRFVLLGTLIIFSQMCFVVFLGFHMFIFFIAVTISRSLLQDNISVNKLSNWREQDDIIGKIEGPIEDVNHLSNVSLVTRFSVDSHFYLESHTLFYFVIPLLENLILFIYMCYLGWATESTVLEFLSILVYVTIFISCTCFFWCYLHSLFTLTDDQINDDKKNQSSSRPLSSLISMFFQTLLCIDLPSIKGGLKWYCNNRHVRHDHQMISNRQIERQLNSTNSEATVLMSWCENYQQENLLDIARMLIESSEDPREYVNSKNALEETALHKLCAQYSHENLFGIVKLLVENGADVNVASLQNRTPLLQLCKYYQGDNLIDIVHLLIQKGANVNAKDSDGKTPLIALCDPCQPQLKIDVIQLLVNSGVSNDDDVAIQVKMLLEEYHARETNLSVKCNEVYRAWNESRERSTSYANALQN